MSVRPGADVEAAYFDDLVASEGEFNPFADVGWRKPQQRFVDLARPRPELRVLDIGCGTGQSRQIYIDHAAHYTGVDLAEGALVRARTKFPDDRWLCHDARELPFEAGSFDLVAFSSVLHHIADCPVRCPPESLCSHAGSDGSRRPYPDQ